MDIEFAKTFANHWIASWNAHDIDKIISHYAQQLEYTSPLIVERFSDPDGTIFSRDKLKEYFQIGLMKNPQLRFEFSQLLLGVKGLTLYYKNARGGRTAEYFEFNSDMKVVKVISCYSV
jgi:hypothetical protein